MKSTIRGMFLLGRGKREGIYEFSNTSDAVLNALAPWIALAVVGNILPLLSLHSKNIHAVYFSITAFLVKICCLLATVAIIHLYSVIWKKEESWKKTVSAGFWCSWVPIIDCFLFFIIAGLLFSGAPNILIALLGLATILYIAYDFWLSWFVVKAGLQITTQKSIIVIATIILSTSIIYSIFFVCNYTYIAQTINEFQQQMQETAKTIQ